MRPLVLGYNAVGGSVRLMPDQRGAHMHVIGSSGSGKSKFLEWMMRGDLQSRQGFCLIDPHGELYHDVMRYCAHHVSRQEIIPLDLSRADQVVSFNPFRRQPDADIAVQVDHRIAATMHAWNVRNTDQTPTLERTLRLIYTVMLDQGLGIAQVQHLIDFNAGAIREHLITNLESPLIKREWQELQTLKPKEWRDEILSAKNRLFRFLTSPVLNRFMGLPDRTINLQQVMDEGKVLLVNLNPSDNLSEENARVFGALLVNEFFEAARRREKDSAGKPPRPYYLYIDEFQNFVSLDVADMLDQVRKRGLFMILAHQRFGQLDENITDAVIANCRIKAVFGGLPVESARRMAEELFIRELDPQKIKVAIYQTKFWPKYSRDKTYTTSRSSSKSSGTSTNSASASYSGKGASTFFEPADWFLGSPGQVGMSENLSSGSSQMSGSGISENKSSGTSYSEADIPILLPVPFQELSSLQYFTTDEQLLELTAALKEQFQRHCFIKVHHEATQPLLVPLVEDFYTSEKNRNWYKAKLFTESHALPAAEVDRLIELNESALLEMVAKAQQVETEPPSEDPSEPPPKSRRRTKPKPKPKQTIFDDVLFDSEKPDSAGEG